MPDTKAYPITFKGSATPVATKFLKSDPIVLDFAGTIDLDPTDAANLANVQKAFQSEMADRVKKHLGALNTFLQQKDKVIDDLVTKFETLKKDGFPDTPQSATVRVQTLKEMATIGVQIKTFPEEYIQIVQDWAVNVRDQGVHICMLTAVKKARLKTFQEKAFRVRLGQIVKVTLVVAAIALAVAAIVVTAGTTAPLFIGLAAAGAGIAGISSLAGVGKMIVANATMEKKLLANLGKDVQAVKDALAPLDNTKSSLAKHVTEMRNRINVRTDQIKKLEQEIAKHSASAKGYATALGQLKQDPTVLPAEIAKRQKNIDGVNAKIQTLLGQITKLQQSNGKGQELLNLLESMNVELNKISGQAANSVLGNLKEYFTSVDGWIDFGNNIGGLVGNASGIQPA
jgi:prefoldin subunit 5